MSATFLPSSASSQTSLDQLPLTSDGWSFGAPAGRRRPLPTQAWLPATRMGDVVHGFVIRTRVACVFDSRCASLVSSERSTRLADHFASRHRRGARAPPLAAKLRVSSACAGRASSATSPAARDRGVGRVRELRRHRRNAWRRRARAVASAACARRLRTLDRSGHAEYRAGPKSSAARTASVEWSCLRTFAIGISAASLPMPDNKLQLR